MADDGIDEAWRRNLKGMPAPDHLIRRTCRACGSHDVIAEAGEFRCQECPAMWKIPVFRKEQKGATGDG